MSQAVPDSDLVVSTPERVSFDYQVAGLGTRGIAQILDLLIVLGLLIAVFLFAAAVVSTTQSDVVGTLIELFGSFVQGLLISAGNCHPRAFIQKALGCCQTDAAVTAGDDRYFAFKSFHKILRPRRACKYG